MALFPLSGSAELAARVNTYNWSATALGPIEGWPQGLRTALGIILGSRFPMQLLWGPEYIHFYNDAYIPIAGDKHPAALGRPGAAVWPEIWDAVRVALERVRTTGEPSWSDDELLVLYRGGALGEGYYTFSYSPVYDDGAVGGIFVAVTETTRRVLDERRLRTTRDLGAALAGLVDEAAVLGAAQATLGRNPHDLPFVLCYTREGPDEPATLSWSCGVAADHPLARAAWPAAEAEAAGVPQIVAAPLAELPPVLAEPWGAPVSAAALLPLAAPGLAMGYLVVGLSPRLTPDERYLEFLLRVAGQLAAAIDGARAYQRATQAVRIRDDFLSIAAHELKTPLTPIVGRLLLTRRRLAAAGVEQRHLDDLERIAGQAHRLADLIDAVLDVTQLRSGQLTIERRPVDLAELASLVIAEFQIAFATHSFTLRRPDAPAVLLGDGVRLGQVLRNLLNNAVKYSPGGGLVSLELAVIPGAISFSVQDEGVGMAPEVIARVFERYYRAESAVSTGVGGLGIGLFVVHEVVRFHGGNISVESTLGSGSRFTITLPLRP